MTRPCLSLVGLVLLTTSAAAAPPPPAASAAAFHPRGKFVAFGTHGEVRLFDPQTGATVRKLPGQTGRVTALAFSPDGAVLAVASGEPGKAGVVRFHAIGESGQDDRPPATLTVHTDAVYALAFTPDGKLIASAGYDRVIHLSDVSHVADGKVEPKLALKDHSDTVYGLSFHPDGKLLASAAGDRAVKVWDVESGKRIYTLSDPTDWVYAVTWSPDKKHLAAAGVDRSIRVWAADRDGGKLVNSVFAHAGSVWRLGYSADGKTLFSAGEDRVVKAWDATKMVETRTFAAQPDAILGFAVRPDGKQLAVGRFDGVGLLLDADTGKQLSQVLPAKVLAIVAERLTPAAGVRGRTVRVTLTGKNLDELRSVAMSNPAVGIKTLSKAAGKVELELTIPADLPAGAVQLTLENEAGKAGPLSFAVDRYPATPEAGLTDSAQRAMPVTLPATLVGSVDRAGDVDYFRFDAKAGQQVGAQAITVELGSKLDPVLILTDATGVVLAEGTGGLLGFTVPKAGTYAVGVRDRDFRGGPDMTYRLQLGDVPVVTGVFPLAAARGKTTTVHVEGVNLGRPTGLIITVTPPATALPGSKHTVTVPKTPTGEVPLGSAVVIVDEHPSVVVDPAAGAELRVPGSADGILNRPNAPQTARFTAKKGDCLIVEVLARRAGSPVDPILEILDAAGKPVPRATLRCTAKTFTTFRDHDSASPGIRLEYWNELATNDYLYVDGELTRIFNLPRNPDDDCQFYQVAGQRLGFLDTTPAHHSMGSPMYKVELHPPGRTFPPNGLPVFTLNYRNDDGGPGFGKDSRVFFDVPADGTYQARVSDARGAGGPNHAYRLTVRRPKPDFAITFTPTAPTVWKGGAIPIAATATRLDGFDGPIRLELQGLPPGFTAPATFIEGNQTTTAFALFADADAKVPAGTKLNLVAKGTVDGKELVREVTGGLPKLAEPGDIITTTRQNTLVIRPGHETRIVVDVERKGDFKGRIPLDVRGLPHGVRVLNVGLNGILVTERDTSREIVIYAEPWVQPMEHPIVVLARSERKNTEHAAKSVLLRVDR